jgi:AcrR family transcriptional regulator
MDKEKGPDLEAMFGVGLSEEEMTKRQWQILEAAIKVFAEKGYEASRTSEIAKEAEVAEGTIFRYYKTKKDLLKGLLVPMLIKVFRPLMFRSIERIIENKENHSIRDIFKSIYLDRLALVKKNKPLIKTVMIEAQYHPELLKPIQEQIAPKLIPIIDQFIEQKIKDGTLKDIEPRLITRTTISLLIGYVILTNTLPTVFTVDNDEEEIEKIIDILLTGIQKDTKEEG